MPRLLLFAACEKLIASQEDNAFTIISILQGYTLPTAPPAPTPETPYLVVPISWYAFTLWESNNEAAERFSQRIQLVAPDGTVLSSNEMPVVTAGNEAKRFHRTAMKRIGFSILGVGDYMLRLSVRDGDGEYVEFADRAFPIPITVATE
jgi:hypothetical protein